MLPIALIMPTAAAAADLLFFAVCGLIPCHAFQEPYANIGKAR
jgi:hypothetical protein